MPRTSKIARFTVFLTCLAASTACKKHDLGPATATNPHQDVCVLGKTGDSVVYWKNGAPTLLAAGNPVTTITAMFLSGNDIYSAGTENIAGTDYAAWWKNGSPTHLGSGGNAIAIAVH